MVYKAVIKFNVSSYKKNSMNPVFFNVISISEGLFFTNFLFFQYFVIVNSFYPYHNMLHRTFGLIRFNSLVMCNR